MKTVINCVSYFIICFRIIDLNHLMMNVKLKVITFTNKIFKNLFRIINKKILLLLKIKKTVYKIF